MLTLALQTTPNHLLGVQFGHLRDTEIADPLITWRMACNSIARE
jgi:hypothetical protein